MIRNIPGQEHILEELITLKSMLARGVKERGPQGPQGAPASLGLQVYTR